MRSLFTLLLFIPLLVWGQNHQHYHPLLSQGEIPNDFIALSKEVQEIDQSIAKDDKAFEKKAKRDFVKLNSYTLHDLLYSGNVVFNDTISNYINQIADKVFITEPELRKRLRFYTMKSTEVNAFTTHNGIIFVTTGLLARMKNEAQLAFILCHEAVHYKEKHNIEGYVEATEIEKGKGEYNKLSSEEKILQHYTYSKELESEADLAGYDIYKKSGYNVLAIDHVFDILKYSYLPYDSVRVQRSFFETKQFAYPDHYFIPQSDIKKINTSKRNDRRSTHPSAEFRKEAIQQQVNVNGNKKGANFLLNKTDFFNVQLIARREVMNEYVHNLEYQNAIHNFYS